MRNSWATQLVEINLHKTQDAFPRRSSIFTYLLPSLRSAGTLWLISLSQSPDGSGDPAYDPIYSFTAGDLKFGLGSSAYGQGSGQVYTFGTGTTHSDGTVFYKVKTSIVHPQATMFARVVVVLQCASSGRFSL